MGRLTGKVAIITGAAQGMGASHARLFAAEGAKVVLTDIQSIEGAALAESIGGDAYFVRHDVTSPDEWTRIADDAEERFGSIDILVNNAGIIGPLANSVDIAMPDYQRVIDINQHGVFYGMRAVVPAMRRTGGGAIVNISSIAGMIACHGFPNLAYVASKFAVRGMTKAAAAEFGQFNIRVNSVHPGFIKTPMMVAATDAEGGGASDMIMLNRMADPVEVSNLVLFLSSGESSFITAMEHVVDGGMTGW